MKPIKIQLYHNPRCSTSRSALALLEERGVELEIIDYLKSPLTAEELKSLLKKLKLGPNEIIRVKEAVFKEKYEDVELTDSQWIKALLKYPVLMERPIAVRGNKAVIGRPVEEILTLL